MRLTQTINIYIQADRATASGRYVDVCEKCGAFCEPYAPCELCRSDEDPPAKDPMNQDLVLPYEPDEWWDE